MNELGALLRDVRRQSGDPVEVVILAVAVRYCIVPMVGNGTFGEVSELRFGAGVGLKAGGRRRSPHHVQTDLNGGGDILRVKQAGRISLVTFPG